MAHFLYLFPPSPVSGDTCHCTSQRACPGSRLNIPTPIRVQVFIADLEGTSRGRLKRNSIVDEGRCASLHPRLRSWLKIRRKLEGQQRPKMGTRTSLLEHSKELCCSNLLSQQLAFGILLLKHS